MLVSAVERARQEMQGKQERSDTLPAPPRTIQTDDQLLCDGQLAIVQIRICGCDKFARHPVDMTEVARPFYVFASSRRKPGASVPRAAARRAQRVQQPASGALYPSSSSLPAHHIER